MPHPLFKQVETTSPERRIDKNSDSVFRVAQITDFHIPSETKLISRLRDLLGNDLDAERFSRDISAIYNELSHPYRTRLQEYTNLIKKVFIGLHRIGVDHLIVTGDIAHCGLPVEFSEFSGVLKATDWCEDRAPTIVAGNHDRFNLYSDHSERTVDSFFDVVTPKSPRLSNLTPNIILLEFDSNRPPDVHRPEGNWLPNAMGCVTGEELDWLDSHAPRINDADYVIVAIHHHLDDGWYKGRASSYGGYMAPAYRGDELAKRLDALDPEVFILHGHRHIVMPIGYRLRSNRMGCPGAFFDSRRFNLIDFPRSRPPSMSQLELRG